MRIMNTNDNDRSVLMDEKQNSEEIWPCEVKKKTNNWTNVCTKKGFWVDVRKVLRVSRYKVRHRTSLIKN